MASAGRRVPVYLEVGRRKVFACTVDWPGWCRSGKSDVAALEALVAYRDRYAVVAQRAGKRLPVATVDDLGVVERVTGNATTDFGAPAIVPALDHEPMTAAGARRMAELVEAAWDVLADVAAVAPATLRKGPRGGGRDRDAVIQHVLAAEAAYARKIGVRHKEPQLSDPRAVVQLRTEIAESLRAARGGPPDEERGWPSRYAARRIAWHVLDHAWEIEDRSDE